LNEQATGEAFILAREALRKVEESRDAREGRVSLVRCASGRVEEFGNLVFGLQDPLVLAITARQWANIDTVVERGSQKNAARKLRVERSTVSRSLARAKYWPIEESIAAAGRLFGEIVREEEARGRRP
jgi:ATP phosphoribosyltransferase